MTIGAVIVTYNSGQYVQGCIESLIREGINQIVVIDSASTDTTPKEIRNFKLQYILLQENKGFGHAANRGVKELNTDYVLFINPDAYLAPGALQSIWDAFTENPAIKIAGIVLQGNNTVPEKDSFGDEPTLQNLCIRKIVRKQLPHQPFQVSWVSGGAFVINRELFFACSGFDEAFFLYWEDVDVCRRLRDAGHLVWVVPSARAFHVRGGSKLHGKTKTRIYDASADRYYKKHYPIYIWFMQRIARKLYRIVRPNAR